jgi:hypothetical protein
MRWTICWIPFSSTNKIRLINSITYVLKTIYFGKHKIRAVDAQILIASRVLHLREKPSLQY